jgi:LPXTG-motif cell wall-anchored protein
MQNATGDGFPWYYIVGGAVALLAAAAMFLSKKPRAVAGYRKRRFREFEPEDQLSGFGGCRRR